MGRSIELPDPELLASYAIESFVQWHDRLDAAILHQNAAQLPEHRQNTPFPHQHHSQKTDSVLTRPNPHLDAEPSPNGLGIQSKTQPSHRQCAHCQPHLATQDSALVERFW